MSERFTSGAVMCHAQSSNRRRRQHQKCYNKEQFSFRCILKVVMVGLAELFVTGDREFQTAGRAIMLNALDWKLILVAKLTGGSQTDRQTERQTEGRLNV